MNESMESQVKGHQDSEKIDSLPERMTFASSIVDVGLAQYQIEWQRISSMQQSAGVLITALAIVCSISLVFFSITPDNLLMRDKPWFLSYVCPLLFVNVVFIVSTVIFFFRLIWPSYVKGMANPLKLLKQIDYGELWKDNGELAKQLDITIMSIHNLVERKAILYYRSLLSCISAFLTILLIGFVYIIKAALTIPSLKPIIFYIALVSFVLIALYLIFIKEWKYGTN